MLYLTTLLLTEANKPWIYVLGGIVLALGIAITVLVLMQSGKDKSLSGAIAGGAETFFGKNKAKAMDKVLSNLTIILSAVFVVAAVALVIVI